MQRTRSINNRCSAEVPQTVDLSLENPRLNLFSQETDPNHSLKISQLENPQNAHQPPETIFESYAIGHSRIEFNANEIVEIWNGFKLWLEASGPLNYETLQEYQFDIRPVFFSKARKNPALSFCIKSVISKRPNKAPKA